MFGKDNWFSFVVLGFVVLKKMVVCLCSVGLVFVIVVGVLDNLFECVVDVVIKEWG